MILQVVLNVHLDGVVLGSVLEDFVSLFHLGELEAVCDKHVWLQLTGDNLLEQLLCGVSGDETGGDLDVLDPELLQLEGNGLTVDTNVSDSTTRSNKLLTELESGWDTDALNGDIDTRLTDCGGSPLLDERDGIGLTRVDGLVSTELLGDLESGVIHVNGDNFLRVEGLGREQSRKTDWSKTNDGDSVTFLDLTRDHTNLVGSWKNIGEHDERFEWNSLWALVERVVSEGDTELLGLSTVDVVTQDPARGTFGVHAVRLQVVLAVVALSARRDTGDDTDVTRLEVLDSRADLRQFDDTLVSENDSSLRGVLSDDGCIDFWRVSLHDVEVRTANGRCQHLTDGIGRLEDLRLGHILELNHVGLDVGECFHHLDNVCFDARSQ